MTRKAFLSKNTPIPTTSSLCKQALLVLLITGFVAGCGTLKLEKDTENVKERGGFSSGFGLFGGGDATQTQNSEQELGVNGFIWQATLDALSFMPMTSADPIGGIVITDWYQSRGAPKERFKVTATGPICRRKARTRTHSTPETTHRRDTVPTRSLLCA